MEAELAVQAQVDPGNPASRSAYPEFVINVQQFRVYLGMLEGQSHIAMIHTLGAYYSVTVATSTYQGKVLAFIGDWRATKEPTPVCLPSTKMWDWYSDTAVTDYDKFKDYHATVENKGSLWTPVASNGTLTDIKVPNLLAIPNVLVDLLRNQGAAVTSFEVLESVDALIEESGEGEEQWELVRKWCLVAGQAGTNSKTTVNPKTMQVTINNEEFDRWMTTCLDITFGPRPSASTGLLAVAAGPPQQGLDDFALSRILATTIGVNMLQFSQAVAPTARGRWGGVGR